MCRRASCAASRVIKTPTTRFALLWAWGLPPLVPAAVFVIIEVREVRIAARIEVRIAAPIEVLVEVRLEVRLEARIGVPI